MIEFRIVKKVREINGEEVAKEEVDAQCKRWLSELEAKN